MTVRYAGERVDRPNILWVSVEDINPLLGCYGNSYATTPHLDGFAQQGIRYANAHSMAPVCSASRAAIITGIAACSLGTHHHRSAVTAPDFMRLLPAYLRDAGYFTSNCVKTDYNLRGPSARTTVLPSPAKPGVSGTAPRTGASAGTGSRSSQYSTTPSATRS